jgi:hypothetical protein
MLCGFFKGRWTGDKYKKTTLLVVFQANKILSFSEIYKYGG